MAVATQEPRAGGAGHVTMRIENRRESRFEYKTVATVIDGTDEEARACPKKCWTHDLSPSGARLMSLEPLQSPQVLVKFLLPESRDHFFEARIVSQMVSEQVDFTNHRHNLYLYGIRFTRVVN